MIMPLKHIKGELGYGDEKGKTDPRVSALGDAFLKKALDMSSTIMVAYLLQKPDEQSAELEVEWLGDDRLALMRFSRTSKNWKLILATAPEYKEKSTTS